MFLAETNQLNSWKKYKQFFACQGQISVTISQYSRSKQEVAYKIFAPLFFFAHGPFFFFTWKDLVKLFLYLCWWVSRLQHMQWTALCWNTAQRTISLRQLSATSVWTCWMLRYENPTTATSFNKLMVFQLCHLQFPFINIVLHAALVACHPEVWGNVSSLFRFTWMQIGEGKAVCQHKKKVKLLIKYTALSS